MLETVAAHVLLSMTVKTTMFLRNAEDPCHQKRFKFSSERLTAFRLQREMQERDFLASLRRETNLYVIQKITKKRVENSEAEELVWS